jgi:hypothetical protein
MQLPSLIHFVNSILTSHIDGVTMASSLSQKSLQIQIQDDLKYDIRIENAKLERYFLPCLGDFEGGILSKACTAANSTMRMTKAIS